MSVDKKISEKLVFGLDIGTRSIVGTVGHLSGDQFIILAQRQKEHETRAMIDGQIHDIGKVGESIRAVKEELEIAIHQKLTDVCIAAAGRVLRTITVTSENAFEQEREVTQEDIYGLAPLAIEKAYTEIKKRKDEKVKFYCVGYSVIRYYLNGYPMTNLEGHKATTISADMIATFLPEDVVDGLYKAVELAGLKVANLTLEPIAAIGLAIPEMYRMLNLALIDVGAGTSDISITDDGSIISYGMIPMAGDCLTEKVAKKCLVDFVTADRIKRESTDNEVVTYKDILGLEQKISREDILKEIGPQIEIMAKEAADKIRELNGGKSVSAVFVVGGGGKIPGYTKTVAHELGIAEERVALRGEEVMSNIVFEEDTKKDSLLVTPIGICLSYYNQSNNFIFVTFNKTRIKLYDNDKLAVVDAAIQAEFSNDGLFPKRGKALEFMVNGKNRIIRGSLGETAKIIVNGKTADIHTEIHSNDTITVIESTAGEPAKITIDKLPEFKETISFIVNEKKVSCPKYAVVNGEMKSGYYEIQENDQIDFQDYYSVQMIAEFMDIVINDEINLYVNNLPAQKDTKVYENFSVVLSLEPVIFREKSEEKSEDSKETIERITESKIEEKREKITTNHEGNKKIVVVVNNNPIVLNGKQSYVFVDVFDKIDFDLSKPQGLGIVTTKNGTPAQYMEEIQDGDVIEIYWKQNEKM